MIDQLMNGKILSHVLTVRYIIPAADRKSNVSKCRKVAMVNAIVSYTHVAMEKVGRYTSLVYTN